MDMSIIEQLSSSLERKDEVPNIALAEKIVAQNNTSAIDLLIETLANKKLQNDCIKVLYEIGERQPELIRQYTPIFMEYLSHKNNRLQWGAMTALSTISKVEPATIFEHLPTILKAAQKGSVITRDQAVNILLHLSTLPTYQNDALQLLMEILMNCPVNQLPMYTEKTLSVITPKLKTSFLQLLQQRLPEIEKESKRKRIEKVMGKLVG